MWSSSLGVAASAAGLVCIVASPAHAQEPASVPPKCTPDLTHTCAPSPAPASSSPTGRPLVWIGATVFVLPYIASSLAATTSYRHDTDDTTPHGSLWIPVVGPFIDMGTTSGAGNQILLALDGLAQIGGLTLFIYGQTTPKAARPASDADRRVTVSVASLVARGTGGAALFASF